MDYVINDPYLRGLLIQYMIVVVIILVLTIVSFIVLYIQLKKTFKR